MQQCRGKSSMPTKIQRNVSSQNYFTFILLQELQYESVKKTIIGIKSGNYVNLVKYQPRI